MIVISSKKAYSYYCKKEICKSCSLKLYVKMFKEIKRDCIAQGKQFNPDTFAINFFETYELPYKQSVDWTLKDSYHDIHN